MLSISVRDVITKILSVNLFLNNLAKKSKCNIIVTHLLLFCRIIHAKIKADDNGNVRRFIVVDAAKEAQDLTDDVAQIRKQHLAEDFPQLNSADFTSEADYRAALLNQYRQLRQKEYEYICLSEGTMAFDVAVRCGGKMNDKIWDGGRYKRVESIIADSLACTTAPKIVPEYCQNYSKRGTFCCAVSACALEAAVCDRMGITGLIKKDARNASAAELAPFSAELKVSGQGKNEMWKLVEEGQIGPGDQISRDSTGNSNSGKHAEVIVAVNYDDNNKLKYYVVQGNNRAKLQVIDSGTAYPPSVTRKIRGKKVTKPGNFTVGCMNKWMGEQLDLEAENMRLLPTAELENQVALQKDSVVTEIEDLQQAEQHLFGLRTGSDSLRKMIDNYAASYIRNSGVPKATSLAMEIDAQNAREKEQRDEARLRSNPEITHNENTDNTAEMNLIQAIRNNQYS